MGNTFSVKQYVEKIPINLSIAREYATAARPSRQAGNLIIKVVKEYYEIACLAPDRLHCAAAQLLSQ